MTAQGFLGELWVTIGVDSSGLANATQAVENFKRNVNSSMGSVNSTLNSASNNLYRFGTFATMAFTLPLAALATLGTKSAMELEQIQAKTIALANVSKEQMDAWQGTIIRIGIATNQTSKSISQALYFVASAGVDNASAMKVVEYAAKGAAAGLGETDVIAKLLTYTYNAYGKEVFNAAKIMDSLTVSVREGAAEATDMAGVMGDLIPIAAQMGVTFADLGGMLAGMTQIGLNAHKSATALRQIMMEMIHPSSQATKALDAAARKMGDMSIASINLSKSIQNEGLFTILQRLKTVSETMGPLFLPTVFDNVRAFNGLMAMIGPNMNKVQEIIKKTKTEIGAFENALGIMTQTSEFKFGQFKKAAELAFIDLGKSILPALLPILESLTKTINDLTNWFKSLSTNTQEWILILGILLAAIGPIAIALSGMIRLFAIIGMAIPILIGGINLLGASFIFLSEMLLAVPGLQLFVAVGLLIPIINELMYGVKELSIQEKVLNDIQIKANQNIIQEKVAIEQLLRVAESEYSSREQKEQAIKTINKIAPEYLSGITEETIRTGEATKAIEKYISVLALKSEAQALTDELVTLEKSRSKELATGADKELSGKQKLFNFMIYGLAAENMAISNAIEKQFAYNATKDALIKRQEIILKQLNAINVAVANGQPLLGLGNVEDLLAMPGGKKDPYAIYLKKLEEIRIKTLLFGNDLKGVFNAISETESAKKTFLDALIEDGKGASKMVKDLATEIKNLQILMNISEDIAIKFNDPFKLFIDDLAPVKDMKDWWEEWDKIQKKYTESIDKNDTNQISSRRGKGGSPWKTDSANYKAEVNKLKDLRDLYNEMGFTDMGTMYQKRAEDMMKPFENMIKFQKFNEKFQQIGQQMTQMISSYVSMIDQQQTKAISFMEKTAAAQGKSAEQISKQKEDIDARYARKKKAAAIAEAVINGALAITNIWAHTADITGVGYKIVLSALSAANTAMQIGVISGAQMAEGGIVPSGYRNDTYPALLSSGEMVVPPSKLPNMLGAGKQQIILKGELVARGKDLVYVFQQQNILSNSY